MGYDEQPVYDSEDDHEEEVHLVRQSADVDKHSLTDQSRLSSHEYNRQHTNSVDNVQDDDKLIDTRFESAIKTFDSEVQENDQLIDDKIQTKGKKKK